MNPYKVGLIALTAVGELFTVGRIGKPRGPVTLREAAITSAVNLAVIVAVVLA